MKVFVDSTGNQRPIKITIGACERIRALSGVDVLSANPADLARLFDEPVTLAKAIVAAVGDDAFTLDSLDAQTYTNAQKAFYEELSDFFQLLGRTDLTTILARMRAMADEAIRQREKVVRTKFAEPFTKPPEPSESTPED